MSRARAPLLVRQRMSSRWVLPLLQAHAGDPVARLAAVSGTLRLEAAKVSSHEDTQDLALVDSRGLAALVELTSPAATHAPAGASPTEEKGAATPLMASVPRARDTAEDGRVSPSLQLAEAEGGAPKPMAGFVRSPTVDGPPHDVLLASESFNADVAPVPALADMSEAMLEAVLEARKDLVHYLQVAAEVESALRWVDAQSQATVLMVDRLLAGLHEEATCVTARQMLQVLMQCDAFHECIVATYTVRPGLWSTTTVGHLMETLLVDPRATVCFQAWLALHAVFFTSPGENSAPVAPRIVTFLARHAHDFLNVVVRCLRDPNYMARRMMLKTVMEILALPHPWWDIGRYVMHSPAVLSSVMLCAEDASTFITFDAFHTLKNFIAYPKKCTAVRMLLDANRVPLAQWIMSMSSKDDGNGEQSRLLKHLAAVQPLSLSEASALAHIGQWDPPPVKP